MLLFVNVVSVFSLTHETSLVYSNDILPCHKWKWSFQHPPNSLTFTFIVLFEVSLLSTLANKATSRLTTRTHPGLQHPIPYPNDTKKIDAMLDYKDKIAFKYERTLFEIPWWLSAHSHEWKGLLLMKTVLTHDQSWGPLQSRGKIREHIARFIGSVLLAISGGLNSILVATAPLGSSSQSAVIRTMSLSFSSAVIKV